MCRVMEQEQKKFLILVLVGLFFCTSHAVLVDSDVDARHRSDIYLRWYATR